MRITWEHVALRIPKDVMLTLLADWRWLVDDAYSPIVVTSMGDMVLAGPGGRIFLLDTGGCELLEIAGSLDAFQKALAIKENAKAWFLTSALGDLLEAGATLKPNECFGYKVPPVLSGTRDPSNFEPTDIAVHFSVCGQIGMQTRDLPPGTVIDKLTDDDGNG